MKTEYDENVLDYWNVPYGNYILKMKKDDRLDDDCDIKNTLPAHLGAFILGNSKRIMNNFIREINGFYNNNIDYTDTDSLYIEKNNEICWIKLKGLEKNYVMAKMIIKLVLYSTD